MLQKDLATRLGISTAMVSRLVRRGMPTASVEAAERWRKRHLSPGHRNANAWRRDMQAAARGRSATPLEDDAIDPHDAPPTTEAHDAAGPLRLVHELAALAAELLPLGRFSAIERPLRQALRTVPQHARDRVLIGGDGEATADADARAGWMAVVSLGRGEQDARTPEAHHVLAIIPADVWHALVADVLAVVREEEAHVAESVGSAVMDDADLEFMGNFWYCVATGEIHLPEAPA